MFPVSPEKARALAARLAGLGIHEADLDETFIRSRGKGGQNVNKVATCVVLVHRPTGTVVRCEQARTQGMNRYLARRWLADRVERARLGEASAESQRIERIRRQKRRRSRRARTRMLAEKHARAETKALRGAVRPDGNDPS